MAGHVGVRASHRDANRLRAWTGGCSDSCVKGIVAREERAGPRRTQSMTKEEETLPTMVGEAGLEMSTTARESENWPTT